MSNTSATGGYISPASSPDYDDALTDALHDMIAGISGLSGDLVRPRWQAEPPNRPDPGVTWVAIGLTDGDQDFAPAIEHAGSGDGTDVLLRQETFTLLCSFYGPRGDTVLGIVSDGLFIAQNREAMRAQGIAVVGTGHIVRGANEYINARWYARSDMPIHFRRLVRREYPVLNLLSAEIATEYRDGSIWDRGASIWDAGLTNWDNEIWQVRTSIPMA